MFRISTLFSSFFPGSSLLNVHFGTLTDTLSLYLIKKIAGCRQQVQVLPMQYRYVPVSDFLDFFISFHIVLSNPKSLCESFRVIIFHPVAAAVLIITFETIQDVPNNSKADL